MSVQTTADEIFEIEDSAAFGNYTVRRVNSEDFEVIEDGKIIFEGDDYEVAAYLNSNQLDHHLWSDPDLQG
ncbi:hypothetical protein P8825_14890 [Shouchella clausii]|uniref:hypothetical protein n=1 Tax=Shouchella clausii TaxID=79880 RepID=UPI002DB8B151|nr:hypothetical protein [Shouchella clausii]MEB5480850.1 hypothetical protein [Shouchella clausii]